MVRSLAASLVLQGGNRFGEADESDGASMLAPVGGTYVGCWLLGEERMPVCFSSNENHSSLELTVLTVNEQ